MLRFKFQHHAVLLITLIAFTLSSALAFPRVSVAAPIEAQMQQPNSLSSSKMSSAAHSPNSPCSQLQSDSSAASINCDQTSQSHTHCASCVPMQATVPTELAINATTSSIAKHQDSQDNLPALTLPNLSRPPIQSIWF